MIVCTWANNRNIAQVAFRPKWEKGNQNKSAPFKRNDELLAELPDMVIIINPSSGIHGNLADKAKIPMLRREASGISTATSSKLLST